MIPKTEWTMTYIFIQTCCYGKLLMRTAGLDYALNQAREVWKRLFLSSVATADLLSEPFKVIVKLSLVLN